MRGPDMEPASRSQVFRLPDGARVRMRAIRPQDAGRLEAYVQDLSVESRRNRLFGAVSGLPPDLLDRMLHLNGPDGVTLLVFAAGGDDAIIAEAMQLIEPEHGRCEIAISVADAWQGRGLGTLLLHDLECRARMSGIRYLFADVLRTNAAMKRLAWKEGFGVRDSFTDGARIGLIKDLSISRPLAPCRDRLAMTPVAA